MRRADRLFGIVQHLRNRRFATAQDLAETLGVSVRTIYRDIRDLERSGIPIRGEAGVGYQLIPGFELPPLTFNAAEIEALVFGMRMVESWGDGDLRAAARSVMSKVGAVLPEPLRQALIEAPLFARPTFRPAEDQPMVTMFRKAINSRRQVRVQYSDANGSATERVLCPLALYFWGPKWTLAAWCELRQTYRNFRVDRVVDATLLPDTFSGDDGRRSLPGFVAEMQARAAAAGFVHPRRGDPS